MATPRTIGAIAKLIQLLTRTPRLWMKGLMRWIMRVLLLIGRQPSPQTGFVLPTTALLLLVVTLTVGAIGYRTYTRTQETIGERQQRVIYNAATPAIDRARAKLEFLFDPLRDPRAGGVPSQRQLLGMLLNDGRQIEGAPGPQRFPANPSAPDPYTLPGEERIDIGGGPTGQPDGLPDNAWRYRADTNGDGQLDATVIYSILMTAPPNSPPGSSPQNPLQDSREPALRNRAGRLQVRNAPLSNTNEANIACRRSNGTATGLSLVNGDGWFPDPNNRTRLRKNFQVNAYVVPDSPNSTVTTLEFQQDREATQGFRWAAWFRNDIEIFPGASFNWNGAMHTEGSFIMGGNFIRTFLVSSPDSCIFDDSELTVAKVTRNNVETYAGQFVVGITRDDSTNGTVRVDVDLNNLNQEMTTNNDSIRANVTNTTNFTLEPVLLQTRDESRARGINSGTPPTLPGWNPQTAADAGWLSRVFNRENQGRLIQSPQPTPYLDDLFRADNRLGPEPKVGRTDPRPVESIGPIGSPIPDTEIGAELVRNDPAPGAATSEVGLDGYWERRARQEGLRLIVGQRLELGDAAGWGGPTNANGEAANNSALGPETEPLRPWDGNCSGAANRCNERRQRRTMLDSLPTAQATAVYHARASVGNANRDFPLACLATTVHPGTAGTLDKSSTFENLVPDWMQGTNAIPGYTNGANPLVISDFFRGRGTNGWEFETPAPTDFTNPNSPLMIALNNLANFAGDRQGGAPSFTPPSTSAGEGDVVHPYPSMAMWGDFSVLRRVLALAASSGYDALSPADKSTLHTAACTMGMLAYNVDYLEKLDYDAIPAERLGNAPSLATPNILPAAPTVAQFDALTNADIVPNFSGLRGRIRLLNLIINAPSEAEARRINTRIRDAGVGPDGRLLALPDRTGTGANASSRILSILAGMSNAEQVFMIGGDRNSNPEFYVRLLERWRDDPGAESQNTATRIALQNDIYLAQLIITKEQVARDREFGFFGAYGANSGNVGSNPDPAILAQAPLGRCATWFGTGVNPLAAADPLANLCSFRPRYPILYSLFSARVAQDPATNVRLAAATVDQAYDGSGNDDFLSHPDLRTGGGVNNLMVRDAEDRIQRSGYIIGQNSGITYQVVRPQAIALRPRRLPMPGGLTALGGVTPWALPVGTAATSGFTPNGNDRNRIKVCAVSCSYPAGRSDQAGYPQPVALTASIGAMVQIPFKDHAIFNGRELMTVRTLDLDLDLLRNSTQNLTNDYWLPREGIVYAFREDAVSEANIVRPTRETWSRCDTEAKMQSTANCRMDTEQDAYASVDPPLNLANRITPKPVDYLADPDRRPHGFRLKQGASLVRGGSAANETKSIGISFISPNPAYILGNFNLHQANSGGALLEEFTVPLAADYGNFYTRGSGGGNGTLNGNFAQMTTDQWRPSEVLADAVTILSNSFCDGSIQDALLTAGTDNGRSTQVDGATARRYGCLNNIATTSFLNQNRPMVNPGDPINTQKQARWVTANVADSYPRILPDATGTNPDLGESPMLISRGGLPVQWFNDSNFRAYRTTDGFYRSSRRRPLNDATNNTRVNTILVSGITPTRTNQAYGGLHNFPRFLEWWRGQNLFFSGAFLQLNFSSYATGPFDQDAWEQGTVPASGSGCPENDASREDICYYEAPNRRWGYDPALQYVPPAPVAQRFQQPDSTRSEFYSEPPANDPFIARLIPCVDPNNCRAAR